MRLRLADSTPKVTVDGLKRRSDAHPELVEVSDPQEPQVTVDGLITHRFGLEEACEAVAVAAGKESLKVAIRVL